MISAESLGFLGDELDCREFVVEAISMWHSCTTFSFSFYINENVNTVNGYKHRINSST